MNSNGENFNVPASFSNQVASASSLNYNSPPVQMKTKLQSFWNNMKYGWRIKRDVNLKLDSAIWILGHCYHHKFEDALETAEVTRAMKLDLKSRIWFTYRTQFPPFPGTDLCSDSGWGCMLRCGQMMMAHALLSHIIHRGWRVSGETSKEYRLYRELLRWFGDFPDLPFSVHNLVSFGQKYGRLPGDWYGPTHAAQVLRDALTEAKENHPSLRDITMYVALDGIVFIQDVLDLCTGEATPRTKRNSTASEFSILGEPSKHETDDCQEAQEEGMPSFSDPCPPYEPPPMYQCWKSLILFVSVRLGNERLNPFYIPCLKSLLAYEHCVGVIGGRPKHALYFVGWQDDKLIHMDPHSCQPAVDVKKEDFNEKSFHSSSIRTMSFSEMDPSCAIGFYFKKKEDFLHFVDKFVEITAPMRKNLDYPVFGLANSRRSDIDQLDSHRRCSRTRTIVDDEDYILL